MSVKDSRRGPAHSVGRGVRNVASFLSSVIGNHRVNGGFRDENEQFRLLVDEVEDYAIFMLDPDGYVKTWNKGAKRIKGYDKAEIVGEHFSTFYPEDAVEEGLPEHLLSQAQSQGRTEHEGWRVRKDGSRFWASVTITALYEEGELRGFAKVTRDLTERRKRERRLEQLAHAISHDLRQPIRTLTVDLELIERGSGDALDDDDRELLGDAIGGAKRLRAMVDGLLAYTRSETKAATFETVGCDELVEDVLLDLNALIEERDADVTVGSLPVVYGDREQLHVVFQNLIENAIKYSEEDPQVRVDSERIDEGWRISVQDNGIGILSEERDEIFELFERSHQVEAIEGIGIGLALCKQIVDQHDGDIGVESEPGEGSTFFVVLPAVSRSQHVGRTSPTSNPHVKGTTREGTDD